VTGSLPPPQPQSTVCRCQSVRFPGHPTGFPTDGAVLVSVRPRTSRKRSLPTALGRSISEISSIEAQGEVPTKEAEGVKSCRCSEASDPSRQRLEVLPPSPEGREEDAASAGPSDMEPTCLSTPIR
jgi:hypothetical protein